MVPADYHEFFSGCATVAGALIGLLFVAISVSPHWPAPDAESTMFETRAGVAFAVLINTLVVALVGLGVKVHRREGRDLAIGNLVPWSGPWCST